MESAHARRTTRAAIRVRFAKYLRALDQESGSFLEGRSRAGPGTLGRIRCVGAVQGGIDDGIFPASRHPVLPRACRRVHHLRRLLLLAARADQSQPHVSVHRYQRPKRGQRRRAGGHQCRRWQLDRRHGARQARLRSAAVDHVRAAVAGCRRGLARVSGIRQLRLQLAGVFLALSRSTHRRRTLPACTCMRARFHRGQCRHHPGRAPGRRDRCRCAGQSPAAGVVGHSADCVLRTPRSAACLWRVPGGASDRCAHRQSRGVGQDGADHQLRRERRLLRSRARAVAGIGRTHGAQQCRHAWRGLRWRADRPGHSRADAGDLAVDAWWLGQLAGVRSHLGAAFAGTPLRRGRAQHQPVAACGQWRSHQRVRLPQAGRFGVERIAVGRRLSGTYRCRAR